LRKIMGFKVSITRILMLLVCFILPSGLTFAETAVSDSGAKQLWQLIDYVAVDYGGAVNNGAVVSEAEYAEMLDFTSNATLQSQALPANTAKDAITAAIADLRAAVVRKADASDVKRLAQLANTKLIAAYPIPVAPKKAPDLSRGNVLYSAQCASCHGSKGDGNGPLAATLDPRPIAFTDQERAQSRSLMALFQVISQGVEGTSMPSFATLTDDDRWALAFFIGSMSYDDAMRAQGEKLWKESSDIKNHFPDLAAVTTLTQDSIAQKMSMTNARDITAYLRSKPNVVNDLKPSGVTLSRLRLSESLAALHSGDRAAAMKLGLSAYLDGFEPLEPVVGARNKSLLTAVEGAMLAYRSAVAKGTVAEAEAAAEKLNRLFVDVDEEIGKKGVDPMTTFIGALTILLREGVEALLIVIGIIAFLKKAERPDALRYVHSGWISALFAGVLTWVAATYLVTISGASREVTEGTGSIFAAIVLLTVGLWMHQKSSAGRWQAYLHEKLSAAMFRRTAWALFALSFIAVYREVFETVLFYSALATDGNSGGLLAGFLTAVLLLAIIAWALLRTSAIMPIGKFFSITSVLVMILAVILIGKGSIALQEAGWIGVTPIAGPRIPILGIHPTAETIIAQITVLIIALVGFWLNYLSSRKHHQI
jgi:high-affinity iron transporter